MFEVAGRFRALTGVLLALEGVSVGKRKRTFGSVARLPRFVDYGTIVFVRRKLLAYLDLRKMGPVQLTFWRTPTPSAFIDELLKRRSHDPRSP
jgi:hypothetical protein